MKHRIRKIDKTKPISIWQLVVNDRIFTIPNLLTVIRIILVPLIAYYIYIGEIVVAIAWGFPIAMTDMFDGKIARRYNQGSELGKILDPFADKWLVVWVVTTMYLTGYLPLWFGIFLIFRDLLILFFSKKILRKLVFIPESKIIGKITFTFVTLTLLSLLIKGKILYFSFLIADKIYGAGIIQNGIFGLFIYDSFYPLIPYFGQFMMFITTICIILSLIDYGKRYFILIKN